MLTRSVNTTESASPSPSPNERVGLATGAKAGIAVGAVACFFLFAAPAFCLWIKRRNVSRFPKDGQCFEADPDHEIPRPLVEADPDHEIPRHRSESINIARPSSQPQFGLSISSPPIAGTSAISGSTLQPSPPSNLHGNPYHKRVLVDQILGIDKESLLKELPRIEGKP